MVDMLIIAMGIDMLLLATDMNMILSELHMADMLLLAMDMLLTRLPMVDMLIIANGMDMLLLATNMDMLLPATDHSTGLQILSSGIQRTHTLSSNGHTPWARIWTKTSLPRPRTVLSF